MSFVPEFELGLWNAWIFMGPCLLVMLLTLFFMMKKGAPGSPASAVQRACKSKSTMFVAVLSKFIYFPAVLYSVFAVEIGVDVVLCGFSDCAVGISWICVCVGGLG
jgi:hypothetical protein